MTYPSVATTKAQKVRFDERKPMTAPMSPQPRRPLERGSVGVQPRDQGRGAPSHVLAARATSTVTTASGIATWRSVVTPATLDATATTAR
jgi:hypothetical protein